MKRIDKKAQTEMLFRALLAHEGLPGPNVEWLVAPPRRWRFDYAWPHWKVALEVEGGVWIKGRHTRGAGFLKDMEKYNAAASTGWLVLRTTPAALLTEDTIELLRSTMKQRAA